MPLMALTPLMSMQSINGPHHTYVVLCGGSMLLNMLHNGVDGQMGLIMVLFSVPGNHGFGDDVDHLTTPS